MIGVQREQEHDDDDDDDQVEEEKLAGDWTLYGEWVLARHSVPYDSLPSPFLAFDIHHAPSDTFLATEAVRKLLQKYCPSIHMVPLLKEWKWSDFLVVVTDKKKNENDEDIEENENDDKKKTSTTALLKSPVVLPHQVITWDLVHQQYHSKPSQFNPATRCEGAMIRLEVNGTLLRRCKGVHDEFRAAIDEHWTAKEMVKNGIMIG